MGRHILIKKREHRRKQNLRQRQKKRSILTRGNVICNCPSYVTSDSQNVTVTSYGKSVKSEETKDNSTFHVSEETLEPLTRETQSANLREKYTFNTDPLVVGLREYNFLKKRIHTIQEKETIKE
jgi:hypothetical protein